MKFIPNSQPLTDLSVELLVVPIFQGDEGAVVPDEIKVIDQTWNGVIKSHAQREEFVGKKNTSLHVQIDKQIQTVLLVGLGTRDAVSTESMVNFGAIATRTAKKLKATSIALFLHESISPASVVVGAVLGNYTFTTHKNKTLEKDTKAIESVTVISKKPSLEQEIFTAETIASAVTFSRDLVNLSPSETTPTHLAEVAEKIAKENKDITAKVISKPEMQKLGMGALLGIARGSVQEPKFIHLTYNGGGKKVITLVGKGITFDTGGLSLKPAQGMETMKLDMSGGALVLAIFSVLSKLHPSITVHGLISATENMPGPEAIKPGDVVSAMNGKTIEVLNTDAEGRVVLADAMSYADANIKSDAIIDVATLTGACMIALGEEYAGLFSNNSDLTSALQLAAKNTGEKVWEMPLVDEYNSQLKSEVADIKNIGSRYGGAITGALFIGSFVPEHTPWVHLDIAGPSFQEKDTPTCPHGGTGFGIRMIVDYLMSC